MPFIQRYGCGKTFCSVFILFVSPGWVAQTREGLFAATHSLRGSWVDSGCPLRRMCAWREGWECADGASCSVSRTGDKEKKDATQTWWSSTQAAAVTTLTILNLLKIKHWFYLHLLLFWTECSKPLAPSLVESGKQMGNLRDLKGFITQTSWTEMLRFQPDIAAARGSKLLLLLCWLLPCCAWLAGQLARGEPIKNTDELTAVFQETWTSTAAQQCHGWLPPSHIKLML